ncbi:type IX secretion system membrane protein PorP/SprF [Mariniphaga sediminis]
MKKAGFVFPQSILKLFATILCLFPCLNANSQEKAYWHGISIKNPAAIGSPSDWLFGSYNFSDLGENNLSGFMVGADYEITPQTGTIGLDYIREKFGNEKISILGISYAYSLPLKNLGTLNIGVSTGVRKYETKLASYELIPNPNTSDQYSFNGNNDSFRSFEQTSFINKYVKTGLGLWLQSDKFDLGISYVRLQKLKQKQDADFEITIPSYFSAMGAYKFSAIKKVAIDPYLMVDFLDGKTDFYPGIFLEYNEFLWGGYNNLNLNDLHSLLIGFDIIKRFRVGYSYTFTKIFNSSGLNMHEFLLGIRLK